MAVFYNYRAMPYTAVSQREPTAGLAACAPKPERCLNQAKMPANTKVFADLFVELLAGFEPATC